MKSGFHGFRVIPHSSLCVKPAHENSGVVVRAWTIGAGVDDPLGDRVGLLGDQPSVSSGAEAHGAPGDRLLLLEHHRQTLERPGRAAVPAYRSAAARAAARESSWSRSRSAVDGGFRRVGASRHGVEDLDGGELSRREGA